MRQGTPSPEFSDAAALRAHYRALHQRLWAPPARPQREPEAPQLSERDLLEERRRRQEEESLQATLDDRARLDALVFQVLDPEQLAREPKRIIRRVAAAYRVTYADIVGERRTGEIIRARFAAIAAVREAWPNKSLPELGRLFGGRDHTTMLHALRKMERRGIPQPPPAGIQKL